MRAEHSFRLKTTRRLVLLALALGSWPAGANPTGGEVVAGQANIQSLGNTLTVTTATQNSIINWQTFSIAVDETTNFIQPSSTSSVLNRVLANEPSTLLGSLQSNGKVFLINPYGILVGEGANIDVAGFVASTLNLGNQDFLDGHFDFTATPNAGSVRNDGSISTPEGGSVYLIAPEVENRGLIRTPGGETLLAAGQTVKLVDTGTPGVSVEITGDDTRATNVGQIIADAATVGMAGTLVSNNGVISASSVVEEGGRIFLKATTVDLAGQLAADGAGQGGEVSVQGEVIFQTGTVSATGHAGGSIALEAGNILQAGSLSVQGTGGQGGSIAVTAANALVQTAQASLEASGTTQGGSIELSAAAGQAFLSGASRSNGSQGGTLSVLGSSVVLAAATLDASGSSQGGTVLVGGDFQGANPSVQNAQTVTINAATRIDVSATGQGDGGKAIVWSEQNTVYQGEILARGGAAGGDGGFVEVSSRESLAFGGQVDAGAPAGAAGTLLLDPKNIAINASAASTPTYVALADPSPAAGDAYGGGTIEELANGNIVVASTTDDFAATDAGAVFLFNGSSGALISALYGGSAGDQVGSGGIVQLSNGHFVIGSPNWDSGAVADVGAATWGSATLGVSGSVSSANSMVGVSAGDQIGSAGITALVGNGNYVISSPNWDAPRSTDNGAVTLVDGSAAAAGQVLVTNSLTGDNASDQVGKGGSVALTNGNYVVSSSSWGGGKGAATWRDGTDFTADTVTVANSLYGRLTNDFVGGSIIALPNGNYLVVSRLWDYDDGSFLGAINAGAVTWVNGSTGQLVTGVQGGEVSELNSLVGSSTLDDVGGSAPVVLSNGNYVVSTSSWQNGSGDTVGAVTWGDGVNGTFGFIDSTNSVIGNTDGDSARLGGVLANGNYVVISSSWDSPTTADVGAATWVSGTDGKLTTGTVGGVISAANSLTGSQAGDRIGDFGITALSNGNYVVKSPSWDNGAVANAGAATWGDGANGTVGVVSAANSLVGSSAGDSVGFIVYALSNGNYLVRSTGWDNGAVADAGAVTWGNGATGTSGAVSATNSLVGSSAGDNVGNSVITLTGNGNYVVASPSWDNGALADAGAVTWGNGATGISGVVSAANSLVGSTASDSVGSNGVGVLSNGNYVVLSSSWDNGAIANAGAATWGNGLSGITGQISAANSLVGGTAGDAVGSGFLALGNGNYLVSATQWDNGAIANAGAVTWGSGSSGISGLVSASNSLVGGTAGDQVGSGGMLALTDGNYVVKSFLWDNTGAGIADARAITWGDGAAGTDGAVSTTNSLVGAAAADQLGSGGVTALSNGHFVVSSPLAGGGEGKLHLGSATTGSGTPASATFGSDSSSDYALTTAAIAAILDSGTNLVLQANNDITINSAINVANGSGDGGDLTLQAGRSILVNADITTDNGDLTLKANDANAVYLYRDTGTPVISIASGTTINVGTGALVMNLQPGFDPTVGSISNLGTLYAGANSSILGNFSNGGTFNLTDGTLLLTSGSSITNQGVFNLGGSSNIRLQNSGNGYPSFNNAVGGVVNIATSAGWSFISDPVNQGGILNNAGTINVNQGFTGWEVAYSNASSGVLNIGAGNGVSMQNGQTLQGTINLGAGAMLWVSERHGSNASFDGTTINGTGTVLVSAGIGPVADFANVDASSATLWLNNGGTANFTTGTTTFANLNMTGGTLSGAGILNITDSMSQTGGTQTGSGSTVLASTASASLSSATIDRLLVTHGELSILGLVTASGGILVDTGGVLKGTGTIMGDVTNLAGTVAPGNSPGMLSITGDYVQGPNGILQIELQGDAPGDYDQLYVDLSVTLDGTLEIVLLGGYTPSAGASFPSVIHAGGGFIGDFSSRTYPVGYNFAYLPFTATEMNLGLASATASGAASQPSTGQAIMGTQVAAGPYYGVSYIEPGDIAGTTNDPLVLAGIQDLFVPADSPFAAGIFTGGGADSGAGAGSGSAAGGSGFFADQGGRQTDFPPVSRVPFPLFYSGQHDQPNDLWETPNFRRPFGACSAWGGV